MKSPEQLTEDEAEFINRLIAYYPSAASYPSDRDPPILDAVRELVEEGRVERIVVRDGVHPETGAPAGKVIAYRLTDDYAEEVRRIAAERSDGAKWN